MSQSSSHAFLQAISSVLELPGLSFNGDGVCCLFIPGELEVQIEWQGAEQRLMLLAPVGSLGEDPEGSRARALLSANFLFVGTRGETLSVEPGTRVVFLCAMIDLAVVSIDHAVASFAGFVDTAQRWRERLQSPGFGDAAIAHHHVRA